MSDPSSSGGSYEVPDPDQVRTTRIDLGGAEVGPANTPWSAPQGGWQQQVPPAADWGSLPSDAGRSAAPDDGWVAPPQPEANWDCTASCAGGVEPSPPCGSGWLQSAAALRQATSPAPPGAARRSWLAPRHRDVCQRRHQPRLLAVARLNDVPDANRRWLGLEWLGHRQHRRLRLEQLGRLCLRQRRQLGLRRFVELRFGAPGNVDSIASAVDPALVDINVTLGYQSAQAAATGIVLNSSGLVLTNNHVVDGATSLSATDVGNGQSYSATVVGYDPSADVALIQLQNASGLATAQLGDSSQVTVGEAVVALGNAGGVGGTPSAAGGSIAALDQQITASDDGSGSSEQLTGMIQTNANIQPGDSGGPLVDSSGQVIGIDTAGASSSDASGSGQTTQGFAVPIDAAMTIVNQIQSQTTSATVHIGATAFLGVEIQPSDSQGDFGFGAQSGSGATIADVVSGSPAAQAGLAAGDTIVSIDGQTVDSPTTLSTLLASHHPGDSVTIGWTDTSGAQQSSTVQLASGPAA